MFEKPDCPEATTTLGGDDSKRGMLDMLCPGDSIIPQIITFKHIRNNFFSATANRS